jgi:hypothetical protein
MPVVDTDHGDLRPRCAEGSDEIHVIAEKTEVFWKEAFLKRCPFGLSLFGCVAPRVYPGNRRERQSGAQAKRQIGETFMTRTAPPGPALGGRPGDRRRSWPLQHWRTVPTGNAE